MGLSKKYVFTRKIQNKIEVLTRTVSVCVFQTDRAIRWASSSSSFDLLTVSVSILNLPSLFLCHTDCSGLPSEPLPSSTSCFPAPLTCTTWWSSLSACCRVWSRCVLCVRQCVRWWVSCVFVSAFVGGLDVCLSIYLSVALLCVCQRA